MWGLVLCLLSTGAPIQIKQVIWTGGWHANSFCLFFFLESENWLPGGLLVSSLSLMPRNTPLYFPFRVDQGESEEEDFFFCLFTENRDRGGACQGQWEPFLITAVLSALWSIWPSISSVSAKWVSYFTNGFSERQNVWIISGEKNVHFFLLLTLLVKFSSSQMLISKTHSNISLKWDINV